MKKIILASVVILALSFTAKKFKSKNENLVYIPSGSFFIEKDSLVSVFSFYMTKGEVTNKDYRLFLNDLKAQGRTEDLKIAMVDSNLWGNKSRHNEPYIKYYFSHPSYKNYPVVNITKQGAELYCKWYTKQIQAKYPEKKFQNFRLPMKSEWIYAAKGGLKHSPYPWGGPYTRNTNGDCLANFAQVGDRNIKRNENGEYEIVNKDEFEYSVDDINSSFAILAPSRSYFPNGYGLFNMAGNANEMVADEGVVMGGDWRSGGFDIRVNSEKKYKGASPLTGFRMVSSYVGER